MVDAGSAEELGVAFHGLSEGFLDTQVVPAVGHRGFRWF
jgi:hypothetical protein